MCVHRLAFYPSDNKPYCEGPLSEAEAKNQVYNRPVDSLIEDFPRPLSEPCSEHKITEALSLLQESLQRQLDNFMPSSDITLELPDDFRELMGITDGVQGAGVPSQTDRTTLVRSLKYNVAKAHMPGEEETRTGDYSKGSEINWWRKDGFIPLAALQLGGSNEWRSIYYVLGWDSSDDSSAPPTWKIFDHYDVVLDRYDNLSQFLQHETDHIEAIPGGPAFGGILDAEDKYPDQTRFD